MPHNLPPAPPPLFRLARGMVRSGVLGGYRIIEWMERTKQLDRTAWYPLSRGIGVELPLWRRPNQLNRWEARHYERALVDAVAREIHDAKLPTTLGDCGADVGLMSGLLAARCPEIDEIVACEPNPEAYDILANNLARWPLKARARRAAIADFTGRGRLQSPAYDDSPHAAFLVADPHGEIDVLRVNNLGLNVRQRCLVLKIDVEGGERGVIVGATSTLHQARRWIVTLEAHRKVFERTGVDPIEVARLLEGLGLQRVLLAERPNVVLDLQRPYFEQVTDLPIANLVAVGAASASS
jgi:FkbM family methyltransferase